MKAWAIIWCSFVLIGIIGMCTGARWLWGIVFIAAIMLCGALAEIDTKKNEKDHGRQ